MLYYIIAIGVISFLIYPVFRKLFTKSYKLLNYKINTYTPVYYINLDDNRQRNNNFLNLARNLNFKYVKRIPAVNTKNYESLKKYKDKLSHDSYNFLLENNKTGKRKHHYDLTNGSVGCFLSHLECYKDIIKSNVPYSIIFEDDISFKNNNFWSVIDKINIPDDTDIFLLHGYIYNQNGDNGKVKVFNTTTSYIITNKGAAKLLKLLDKIEMQIDWQISKLSSLEKINVYTDKKICLI